MDEKSLMAQITQLATAVGELQRKVDFILTELKLEYKDTMSPELEEVRALLRQGKKLEAIMAYRRQTKAGLDSAKAAVESIEAGIAPEIKNRKLS